jgi:hypothetical protein
MAKALKKPQPMSSVERFFANTSIDAALGRNDEEPEVSGVPEIETDSAADMVSSDSVRTNLVGEESSLAPPTASESTLSPRSPNVATGMLAPAMRTGNDGGTPRIQVLALVQRTGEPVDRQREFQLTRTTDATLEDLVLLYKRATGAELTRSHVLRAVLKALEEQMPRLERAAAGIGPLRRPSNAKGFEEAREEFEEQIKQAFLRGIRDTE